MPHDNIILHWAFIRAYLLFPSEKKKKTFSWNLFYRGLALTPQHISHHNMLLNLSDAVKYWSTTQACRSVSRMAAIAFSTKLHQLSLNGVEGRRWKAGVLVLYPAPADGVGSPGCRTWGLGALTTLMLSSSHVWHPLCWVAWGGGGRRAVLLCVCWGPSYVCVALTLSKRVLHQGHTERDWSLFCLNHLLVQTTGQNASAVRLCGT